MPDTTYLHIQGRESEPTRVVALAGAAIRVGRGPHCEIAIAEPGLAEVQFLLRRRGTSWQIEPVGSAPMLSIDGGPVDRPRPWPFGVTLQIGSYSLVIREAAWGTYQAPSKAGARFGAARPSEPRPSALSRELSSRATPPAASVDGQDAEVERLKRWQSRLEQRERWLQTRQDEKKWENRWKAAGEGIRAKSAASPRPEVVPPSQDETPRTTRPASTIARIVLPRARVAPRPELPRSIARPISAPADPAPKPRALAVLALPAPEIPQPPVEPPVATDLQAMIEVEPPPVRELPIDAEAGESDAAEEDYLPIERSILIESERSDPIWTAPPGFVADARSTSASFWHEHAYAGEVGPGAPRESDQRDEHPINDSEIPPSVRAEYPTAASIFAASGTRVVSASPSKRLAKRRPEPTEPRSPAEWVMPAWLAGPPVALVAIGMIGVGLLLGLTWAKDDGDAGLAIRAASRGAKDRPVPIDPLLRPESRWWKSTGQHMVAWAVAFERSPDATERADSIRDLLDSARRSAPLQPELRLGLARESAPDAPREPSRSLGLSRDVVSLAATGRSLKRLGKVKPAIVAYRRAMELAAGADPGRLDPVAFDDDPQFRRFRLPHESIIGRVVRDMAEAGDWTPADWAKALPSRPLVRYAAARTLREGGKAESSAIFDLVLADDASNTDDLASTAENLAAKAEALAIKGKPVEAAEAYAKAIEATPDETVRRQWRLGLAEIMATLGKSKERAELLEAAKGPDLTEDVTRRAIDAQKIAGLK